MTVSVDEHQHITDTIENRGVYPNRVGSRSIELIHSYPDVLFN